MLLLELLEHNGMLPSARCFPGGEHFNASSTMILKAGFPVEFIVS